LNKNLLHHWRKKGHL